MAKSNTNFSRLENKKDTNEFTNAINRDIVPYRLKDSKMDLPVELLHYLNLSPWHSAICRNKILQVAGKGIHDKDISDEGIAFLDNINFDGEDINDLLNKCAFDLIVFGGFSLHVVWDSTMKYITDVYHIAYNGVRATPVNENGVVGEYKYSYDWTTRNYNRTVFSAFEYDNQKKKAVKSIIDPSTNAGYTILDGQNQLYYYKPYNPSGFYYPMPDYLPASADIRSDIKGGEYLERGVGSGFAPQVIATFFGNYTEEEKAIETTNLIENYIEAETSNLPLVAFAKDRNTGGLEINNLEETGKDDKFTSYYEIVRQNILTAHRVTSPLLVGISQTGGLGSKEEIQVAYDIFFESVIKPEQQKLVKVFNKILRINGIPDMISLQRFDVKSEDQADDNVTEITNENKEIKEETTEQEGIV